MKLDVQVMAVRARQEYAEDVARHVGVSPDKIVYDDRGFKGGGTAWYNAKRAWLAPLDDDVTRRMVIQDDVLVCNNFLEIANKVITVFPKAVWSFYNGSDLSYNVRKNDSPYILMAGAVVTGLAIIMPVEHIKPMMQWSDENLGKNYKHDDCRIGSYCGWYGIDVFGTIPSLVDHRKIDSTIRYHTSKRRVSWTWTGFDIGNQDWDNADYNIGPALCQPLWKLDDDDENHEFLKKAMKTMSIIKENGKKKKRRLEHLKKNSIGKP